MRIARIGWLTCLAVALPMATRAAEEPAAVGPDPAALFTRLDKDKDGQVTAEEAGDDNGTLFKRLLRNADKNKDNRLARDEFVAGLTTTETPAPAAGSGGPGGFRPGGLMPDASMIFRRMDANADGKVTMDEIPAERRPIFERGLPKFDKDGDKSLTLEEFRPLLAMIAGGPGGPKGPETPKGTEPPKGTPGSKTPEPAKAPLGDFPGVKMMMERIMAGDKNKDGKLSKAELPERMQERFDTLDADKSGFAEEPELRKQLESMAERFKDGKLGKKLDEKKKDKKKE